MLQRKRLSPKINFCADFGATAQGWTFVSCLLKDFWLHFYVLHHSSLISFTFLFKLSLTLSTQLLLQFCPATLASQWAHSAPHTNWTGWGENNWLKIVILLALASLSSKYTHVSSLPGVLLRHQLHSVTFSVQPQVHGWRVKAATATALFSLSLPAKSDMSLQTLSPWKENEPFGSTWHSWHKPTHMPACKDVHRQSHNLSLSSLKLCQCVALSQRSTTVEDLQQLVSSWQRQSMPIICPKPCVLRIYLQTDLEQHNTRSRWMKLSHRRVLFGCVEKRPAHITSSVFQLWKLKC